MHKVHKKQAERIRTQPISAYGAMTIQCTAFAFFARCDGCRRLFGAAFADFAKDRLGIEGLLSRQVHFIYGKLLPWII